MGVGAADPIRAGGGVAGRVARLLAVVAGLLLIAGCGIPTDDSPRALPADPAATVGAPTTAPAGSTNSATIYLGRGEVTDPLVGVRRGLDGPPNPERVLEAVLSPPTASDLEEGLLTFIPAESELLDWELDVPDSLLVIDLSDAFYTREGEAANSAFAQVVLTVTDLTTYRIERVAFRRDGDPIQAFTASPGGPKDVVTRNDYASRDPE